MRPLNPGTWTWSEGPNKTKELYIDSHASASWGPGASEGSGSIDQVGGQTASGLLARGGVLGERLEMEVDML